MSTTKGFPYSAAWLLAMALALPGTARALVTEEGSIQCNAQAYIQADGHAAMAPDELLPADWYSDRGFPGQDKTQMSAPDSQLDAATRAMLLVEKKEPAAERARWSLSYRVLAGSQDEPHINACTLVEPKNVSWTQRVCCSECVLKIAPAFPALPSSMKVVWLGATTRNGHSIPRSCNNARRTQSSAICRVAYSPI